MSEFGREIEYTFRPHRGKEATIKATPNQGGYMYYATDTHRMFFDMDESTRQGVRSEGVIFVYGTAYTEDNKPAECEDVIFIHEITDQPGVYRYPRHKIDGHYNEGDIIINVNDGSFYKIVNTTTDELYVRCELLMVAGSGGSKTGIQLREQTLFPAQLAYGKSATASFVPVSYEGHTSGNIDVYVYRDENANQYASYNRYRARVNEAIEITIPAEDLVAGNGNWIVLIFRTSDGMESVPLTYQINCIDLKFELDSNNWDYAEIFSANNPVVIPWRAYTTKSTVASDLQINVDWTFADTHYPTESTKFVQNQQVTRSFAEATANLPQGTYRIQAKAHVIINNTIVDIGTIDVEIPWVVEGSEDPIIWSKFPATSTVPKFTLISIEYMVYDPVAIANNKTTVKTYLSANGTLVEDEGRDITITNGIASDLWDVAEYVEGENVFSITCRTTTKTFYITIVPNPDMQLDPVSSGCVMWLNAKGRSNNESVTRRASWPNKVSVPSTSFTATAIPQLTGFNWYNNGWQKDSDGNNVLRLSNGAKVTIPIQDLLSFKDRTYEFDFRVFNAINFSKLINITTVYDENGDPVVEKDHAGNEHEVVQKTVSDGEGAFLKYYSNGQGYMLGTQEAFFAYSENAVANVRYADDTRVKVSFVVRYAERSETIVGSSTIVVPEEKYIYIYIDGVLSAAYPIVGNQTDMSCKATAIEINSDYCDVDIYNIRIYESALDYNGIVTNWIGDSSTLQIMSEKYERNNLTIGSGISTSLDYEKVKTSGLIPVMVITTYGDGTGSPEDLLPYKKGDKRMCGVRYYDPTDVSKNFHGYNFEIDVQGTSSQGYPRRNYKVKTKQYDDNQPFYFEYWDGVEENANDYAAAADGLTDDQRDELTMSKWDLGHGVKEKNFCLKADYMESSSTHNTGLANLVADIQAQYQTSDVYDFRHPLTRLHNEKSRTTIYGYPILLFHEQKVIKDGVETTPITFIGKYNFNIDKSATDSFGFTSSTINETSEAIYPEYIECKVDGKKGIYDVNLVPNEDGTGYKTDPDTGALLYYHPADQAETPLLDEDDNPITALRKGSYEQVSECWEFTQNQAGPGKFQEQPGGFYATTDGTESSKIIAADHFEMRYHYADFDDPYESEGSIPAANALFKKYTKNLATMVDWVASTDVSANATRLKNEGTGNLDKALTADQQKRYHTRDTEYNSAHTYYADLTSTEPVDVGLVNTVVMADSDITVDATTFVTQLQTYGDAAVLGDYSISYLADTGVWQLYYIQQSVDDEGNEILDAICIDEALDDLSTTWGITLPENWGEATISFSYVETATKWSASLYQEYSTDSIEYRLAKFRDEFSQHFNLSHTLFYYIITETLLLYDSRQKNMMMASWGPEREGGEYIWYPIFYDMDTQLGVNNSGQVYWDYDVDATPKNNPDASIFSGTGSVFWANVATCFENEIKLAYRLLRQYSTRLHESTLEKAYNTNQSDRWSEQMKNLDAFYKYIAPTSLDYGGFIDIDGNNTTSSTYLYCLQGDRKLNRSAFFRNRLNYMDSQWLGGNYDPSKMSNAITMRYNLNKSDTTSDGLYSEVDGAVFDGDPDYKITPFLTQYVSVAYDQIAADPVRFDIAKIAPDVESTTYAHIKAPDTIKDRATAGVMLTQQLAYVYGPKFISDLGDLSSKYLNIFQSEGAIKLRNMQIGSDKPGYKNTQFKDLDNKENSASSSNAKTLLQNIDFSNLSELAGPYDVSGCLKLKNFKALGTKLTQVPFAKGNLLEKVYFPATIEQISFEAPLSLSGIITDSTRTQWIQNEDGTWTHNNDSGLYIENLTNVLDTTPSEANGSYTAIKYYQVDNSKMGYDSYRMLKYLYDLKQLVRNTKVAILEEEQNNTTLSDERLATKAWADKTDSELRIQVLNAQWTPYEAIEAGSAQNSEITYYVLNDDLTYSEYAGSDWEQDLKDYQIFKRVRDNSPITDLTMFNTFINNFTRESCKIGNENDPYNYRPIFNDAVNETNKLLPIITGDLHVHNTEDTMIKEIDLYEKYGATGRFDELKITAEYVDPCYRAKFIEYNQEGGITIHGWQRSSTAKTIAYSGDKPERLYYDFLGWAYDSEELRANNSIGTEADVVLLPNGYDWIDTATNTTLTTPGETVTLVAVFQLTKWKISFIDGNGNPLIHPTTNNAYWEFSTQEKIVPPVAIPYKTETDLAFTDCYNFIGYTTAAEDTTNIVDFTKAIYPTRDMSYYAQFEVKNIYENPLPEEQLYSALITDSSTGATIGIGVVLNGSYQRTGKICIPKTHKGYNVVGILGKSIQDTDLSVSVSSDFVNNTRLTHIFFEGANDDTCSITDFYNGAFENAANIVYIEIPKTLVAIRDNAFKGMPKLKLTNLQNVTYFGKEFLRGSSKSAGLTADDTLYISGNTEYFGAYSFANTRYHRIQIGTAQKPLATLPNVQAGADYIFGFDILGSALGDRVLTVFTTVDQETAESYFNGLIYTSYPYELDMQFI